MVALLVEDESCPQVAALTGAVDELVAMSFSSLSTRDLPGLAQAVEAQLRRLPVFDHALIAAPAIIELKLGRFSEEDVDAAGQHVDALFGVAVAAEAIEA